MPYPTAPGERVRFTTEFHTQPDDCSACIAGRCLQMVISHPKWDADVVVHDAIGNLDIARMDGLFAEPDIGACAIKRYCAGVYCAGWIANDLPDGPRVIRAIFDLEV